jgi:hypothetical protein
MMEEQELKQLKQVYNILETTLNDFVRDIVDFHRLKAKVDEIRNCINQVAELVPLTFRSSILIHQSLQGLGWSAECLDTILSLKTLYPPTIYYWVGRCISILADVLIQIDCILGKGDDEL